MSELELAGISVLCAVGGCALGMYAPWAGVLVVIFLMGMVLYAAVRERGDEV